MKILIWIGCIFVATILNTILGYSTGIKAGYVVFYFAVYFVAKRLCQKWDGYRVNRKLKAKQKMDENHTAGIDDEICFWRKCGEETVAVMQANRENQPDSKEDADFGLTPQKHLFQNTKWGKGGKLVRVLGNISIPAAFVAIVAIVIAMNFQDLQRNVQETVSPTILYGVLIFGFVALSVVDIIAGICKNIKSMCFTSAALAVYTIVLIAEGSVFSEAYRNEYNKITYYGNNAIVSVCNNVWVLTAFVLLVINNVPIIVAFFRKMLQLWHGSLKYREKCYKRVAKMYSYYQSGIMTQDEYEKMKKIILDRIKD